MAHFIYRSASLPSGPVVEVHDADVLTEGYVDLRVDDATGTGPVTLSLRTTGRYSSASLTIGQVRALRAALVEAEALMVAEEEAARLAHEDGWF